jgi:phosphoribosylanthranilate isomerase
VVRQLLKHEHVRTLLGGGVNFSNVQGIIKEFRPSEVHIGTCVRRDKFGPVERTLLEEFIGRMNYE